MSIRCVVLDFDGTFTDVEAEGAPFVRHFRRRLGEVLGGELGSAWEETASGILAHAESHGWEVGGKVVAPATADPYLLSNCIAHQLFERWSVAWSAEERGRVVEELYREAYAQAGIAFKPEAKEVLEVLLARGLPVYVVTNAHTQLVEKKLDALGPRGRERLKVYGEARKFLVVEPAEMDGVFQALPEAQQVEGVLKRPLWLRRGKYYEALRRIWRETDTSPDTTLVAGDIYELDLALPAALGASVQLVTRTNVLPYEKRAVEALGARGGMDASLHAVVRRLS